jgi:CheY-specific phosphatase CheX
LLDSVGAPLEPLPRTVAVTDDVGASIGFTGPVLRGALVMTSTRRLVRKVLPADLAAEGTDPQIADWTGELANQLLRRIKNKLLAYGVVLEMSTPTVFFGLELARKHTGSTVRRELAFRHGDEPLVVTFDAQTSKDIDLTTPLEEAAAAVAEGDLTLF